LSTIRRDIQLPSTQAKLFFPERSLTVGDLLAIILFQRHEKSKNSFRFCENITKSRLFRKNEMQVFTEWQTSEQQYTHTAGNFNLQIAT
jgi:hypothetical protein